MIRPSNPVKKNAKKDDVPVEIYVGPKVISQPKKAERPKAIVRPNNSANFDKMTENDDEKPVMSLKDVIGASSSMIQSLQSRNLKLQKAKHLWARGKIGKNIFNRNSFLNFFSKMAKDSSNLTFA